MWERLKASVHFWTSNCVLYFNRPQFPCTLFQLLKHFRTLLSAIIQWDHLNKNTNLVTLKSLVNLYWFCRILMSECTLTSFLKCFQNDSFQNQKKKKNVTQTLIRADSCSLILHLSETFCLFVIANSYRFSWFIVYSPIIFTEATGFINSAFKPHLFVFFLSCPPVNVIVPEEEWNCLCWL